MLFRKQSLFIVFSLISLLLSFFGIDLVISDIETKNWALELDQEIVLYGSHFIAITLNVCFFLFIKKRLVQKKILLFTIIWLVAFFIIYYWLLKGFIVFFTISVLCQIVAIKFIKKDDDLIKSVDRIR